MSRRREAERPGEKKARPEKKPRPGRFVRHGPYVVDDRLYGWLSTCDPPIDGSAPPPREESEDGVRAFIEWYCNTAWMRPTHVASALDQGRISPKEAANLMLCYLDAAAVRLKELFERVLSAPRSDEDAAWGPPGVYGRLALFQMSEQLKRFPDDVLCRAIVVAAVALRAGIDLGRLYEAELQAAEIVAGDKVRRGAEQGGLEAREKTRKGRKVEMPSPPRLERIRIWSEELAKELWEDGKPKREAIARVVRRLVKRYRVNSKEEGDCLCARERSFWNRHKAEILDKARKIMRQRPL
ncbi:MAG: hypothetical protein WHV64_18115 [Geminicoccaceae bacterium]